MQSFVESRGIKLPLHPGLSRLILESISNGTYEQPEAELVQTHITSNDIVMEVGTGIGFISSLCAKAIGSERVYSFEANTSLEMIIRTTYQMNKVDPHLNFGLLANTSTPRIFFLTEDFWTSSAVPPSLPAVAVLTPTLSFCEELNRICPTFLIIDIEGGEYELLTTAKLPGVKKILIELHPRVLGEAKVWAVYRALRRAGFRVSQRLSFKKLLRQFLFDFFGVTNGKNLLLVCNKYLNCHFCTTIGLPEHLLLERRA